MIGIALYMFVFNSAQKRITAATGAFLIGSAPVFTSIFSAMFLKERINIMTLLGIGISFCGIAIICFSEKNGVSFDIGVIIMLIAAMLISLYNILVKKITKKYTSLEVTTYAFISGTFFLLVFTPSLLNEMKHIPFTIHLTVIYLGLFPAAIAYVLWGFSLSKGNTTQVASFMYVTPLLTIVMGWFWIREIPSGFSILGGLIIIAGVVITNFKQIARS
jgi:drug/metabolite transporter (DMT)-like permease